MTQCALTSDYYEIPRFSTTGIGEVAEYISKNAEKINAHFQHSNYFGVLARGLIDQLRQIADECKTTGWDGYDALPVMDNTVDFAAGFLMALPPGITPPEIGSEPDGSITFEWYRSPRIIFSVSVSSDGYIHFAFLKGRIIRHGSEPFSGYISGDIVKMINSIISE